jgi:nicotinamidase-related amidase
VRRTEPADLHGNVPDTCSIALVLVDVINDFDFPTGSRLLPRATRAARQLAALKERAARAGVPCIYVNDNHGRWRSDFRAQIRHCVEGQTRGKAIAQLLLPAPEDYFVLKPKHSAFYQTCMSALLDHLGTETVIFLRGYQVIVPRDGSAADDAAGHRVALKQMQRSLHARTPLCSEIRFTRRKGGALSVRAPRGT